MSHYRPFAPEQMFLLPPDLRDWLPEDHLAYFIIDAVEELDLSAFYAASAERDPRGNKAYHPLLMARLLLYAYCMGVPSSRKIEKKTYEDVAYRVLAGNQHPDHATIAEFRKTHLQPLAALFTQVLRLCRAAGLVKLGHVALDGTKVKADAALARNLSYSRLEKTVEELEREMRALLAEAEAVDAAEDAREAREGKAELSAELAKRASRVKKLREARQALEAEARASAEAAAKEAAEKAAQRAREEAESGKKKRGRKSKPVADPAEAKPEETALWNETDPDSRVMVDGRTKAYVQAYNAQAAVTEDQVIVAAEVTWEANDKRQLEPMVAVVEAECGEGPLTVSADAGYFAATAVERVESDGKVLALVSPDREAGRRPGGGGSAAKEAMRERLTRAEYWSLYRKRKVMIEPVFGQIKEVRGFRRFSLRGQAAVSAEWKIICLTHNLLKLFRAGVRLKRVKAA